MPRTITTHTTAYSIDELMSESQRGYWQALSYVEDNYMEWAWEPLLESVIDNIRAESQQPAFTPVMDVTGTYWLPSGRLELPGGTTPSWVDLPEIGYRRMDGDSYFCAVPSSVLAIINDLAAELIESFVMKLENVKAAATDERVLHTYALEGAFLFDMFGGFLGTGEDN